MGWLGRVLLCSLSLVSVMATAKGPQPKEYVEGFVRTSNGHSIYYRKYEGTIEDEAIVFANGLTQDTEHWQTVVTEARKSGKTVVLFDAYLQGRSLQKFVEDEHVIGQIGFRPIVEPLLGEKLVYAGQEPLIPPAPIKEQAEDLAEVLQQLKIRKSTLVGLSYGGALALQYAAKYPRRTERLIMVAPYIEPMADQDKLIRYYMGVYNRAFPLLKLDQEELYDWLLRGLVLTTYHLSEPTILKWGALQPFAVSQMASGVRHMDALELVADLRGTPVDVVIAGNDPYIQRGNLLEFWNSIPEEIQGSLTVIEGVEHKVNESVGPYLGGLVRLLTQGNKKLDAGRAWVGYPERGLLKSKDGRDEFTLPKTAICESILRPTDPRSPNLPIDRIARNPAEVFIQSWRAQLPPSLRKVWDSMAKFWSGQ